MYELSRVLLQSVGPAGARYQNVLLDFSAVGRPVSGGEMPQFGAGAPARRPSPATVLFLENGGGKSVLIKLIFSVVLPGRRQVVGATGGGVLERFVLPKDTAHVVLEWTHARSGRRLITGKVSEWKDQRESTDPRNLIEHWYHFRPTAALGLENLPFSTSNHYLRQAAYLTELAKANAADPALEYFDFARQGAWTERLVELSLDPELFRYQRSMNADEGEAAEAFSFTSDMAFVNFLLSAVLPAGPAKELADLVDTYAERLSRRTELLLEQDFVQGALDILEPLAAAHGSADQARSRRTAAARSMAILLRRLRARAEAEAASVLQIQEETGQLAVERAKRHAEHTRLSAVTVELERLVAQLRWEEAASEYRRAETDAQRAEAAAAAWKITPAILRQLTAEQRLGSLRAVVEAAEEAARPALAARDQAAARLVGALRDAVKDLLDKAAQTEAKAGEVAARAEDHQTEHNEALARSIGWLKEAETAEQHVREVRDAVAIAVRNGLLPPDTSAGTALKEATTAAEENASRLAVLEAEAKRLEDEQQRAAQAVRESEASVAVLHRVLDTAEQDCGAAAARKDALSADPAFVDLLGHGPGDLETAAEALRAGLTEVHDKAVAEITDLRVAEAQDERARIALESTELLPASPEAVQVKEILAEGGITAWTGWEYLAAIPDMDRRRALVERVPQLVGGVLLNNPAQLDAARELISSREPHPSGFLAVGTTKAVAQEHPTVSGVDFVVPPHPALYDERAADAERRLVRQRHHRRGERLTELTERRSSAATLAARLQEWRREFPPGRLAELRERLETQRQLVEDGEREAEERRAVREALRESRTAVLEEAEPVRAAQRGLDERVHRLRGLADRESRVPGWEATAVLHREAGEREQERAHHAAEKAGHGREQAGGLLRETDGLRASASRLGEELAGLPADAEPVAPEQPGVPLEVLRRGYANAAEAYLRASVGDKLLADLQQAEGGATQIATELAEHPDAVVELARQLLDGPEGSDTASRELARRLAEQAAPELRSRAAELSARAAGRKEEFEKFAAPVAVADLTPFEKPRHLGHGLRLVEEAKQAREEAWRVVQDLDGHGRRLKESLADAQVSHQGFEQLMLGWEEFSAFEPAELVDPEPFEGDLSAARAEHQAARAEHEDARKRKAAAEDDERRYSDRLVRHAGREAFLPLETKSRQIILESERSDLPKRATEWAGAMRGRVRSLTDDLDTIDRHRKAIVQQLAQQVADALDTLRRAERLSRLPKGLGDWSGQRFLRIRFKEIGEEALLDRMGQIVDDMAKSTMEAVAAGREPKRDGISLILRGVAAAGAPSGFKVTILKPDAVLRTQRVPVSDIRAVFSGGQILTTAIILYCTMAALRANDRGRVGNQHSGVLFLDNPIGRASATYLLRLQQSVARALGVQLVYTTGLFDTTALDTFPLVVRLRNDADLRARRKYLSVGEVFGRYLDESLPETGGPQISATRYYAKDDGADDSE
ncbi:hypothetical protein KQY30_16690 [Streptomyces sp. GMY02]|uniref:hypothetical protein n=1 Tax=Streptomyces sp. GMY02 TaxID=1333528 RepID=UPI001C2C5D57|nr:hypothetical protein [Streptomyces sp. GMY02]QXE35652.1 hypothetical protein KQY30_16690 [Streptomyces sp. GMY02]